MHLITNEIYHIYNHAVGDDNLFRNEENYAYFLKRYVYFIHPVAITYAYCLMPNHFHLLIKIRSEEELNEAFPKFQTLEKHAVEKFISKQLSNLFSSYTQSFNKVYNRKGSLFIKNFKRKHIHKDAYFSSVIQYIHHNPVHHGFCSAIGDWKWSSYHAVLNDKISLINKQEIIDWFGDKEYFKEAHKYIPADYVALAEEDF